MSSDIKDVSFWVIVEILIELKSEWYSSKGIIFDSELLEISFKKLLGWCGAIEHFRIVSVDGDRAILCCNNE